MDRRRFLVLSSMLGLSLSAGLGCRENQVARVLSDEKKPFISHAVFASSINEALDKLLARQRTWNPSAGGSGW